MTDDLTKDLDFTIGGHDAAAIMGASPHKTPLQVWGEKVGEIVPEDIGDKDYVIRGHEMEPHLLDIYAAVTGREIMEPLGARDEKGICRVHSMIDPRYTSAPDGLVLREAPGIVVAEEPTGRDQWGTLDAKSVGIWVRDKWGDPDENGEAQEVPLAEAIQHQFYMMVEGRPFSSFAVGVVDDRAYRTPLATSRGVALFGLTDFMWKDVNRNDNFIGTMLDRLASFVKCVETKQRPQWGARAEDKSVLAELLGREVTEEPVVLGINDYTLVKAAHKHQAEIKLRQKAVDLINVELMDRLGESAVGQLPNGNCVTFRTRKGHTRPACEIAPKRMLRIPQARHMKELPEDYQVIRKLWGWLKVAKLKLTQTIFYTQERCVICRRKMIVPLGTVRYTCDAFCRRRRRAIQSKMGRHQRTLARQANKKGTGMNTKLMVSNIATVKDLIARHADKITAVLPKHLNPERLTEIATTVIQANPKLAECTPRSLLGAFIQASGVGVSLDPTLGEAYLVPYNTKNGDNWEKRAQFQMGYRGLIKLARNSGDVTTLFAMPVFDGDEYNEEITQDGPTFKHIPKGEPGDDLRCVYMVARFRDGDFHWGRMWAHEIDLVRDRSKGYQNAMKYKKDNPWTTDYVEMAKKTVVRREAKYLPLSTEVQRAVAEDERIDLGIAESTVIDIPGEDEPAPVTAEEVGVVQPERAAIQDDLDAVAAKVEEEDHVAAGDPPPLGESAAPKPRAKRGGKGKETEYGCRECGVMNKVLAGRRTFQCRGCGHANALTKSE